MRSVLHLYIFVEEDILEIELSSNKTRPDVTRDFIKCLVQHLLSSTRIGVTLYPRSGVLTGYLPEINHHTRPRTIQVPLVVMKPPLIPTLYFIKENFPYA